MANRAAALVAQANREPGRIAIVHEGREIGFGDLAEQVYHVAGALAAQGIGQGSRVGLMMPAQPEFIVIQYALFVLGAVFAPLNIFYRPAEVGHVVDCCELEYLILADPLVDRRPPDGDGHTASLRAVITAGVLLEAAAAAVPVRSLAPVAAQDTAMLLQTSATTGKSKGVVLSAGALAANYDQTPGWLGVGRDDVIICALPLYNTFGLNQCINAMALTGLTLVLHPRFDAGACIADIARYGCTYMPGVPTMLQKLVDHPGLRSGQLSSLKRIMTGGAPVPAPLLARLLQATDGNAQVLTGYGLTEASALVTLAQVELGEDGEVLRGRTIGRVLDGIELEVHDENGNQLAAGEVGEFVIRGPNVMAGYYNAPEANAEVFGGDWLRSGDLGTIDADGFAFIVDRKKDVIIRGGQNIYPADIEEALYQLADVTEAAVIGAPDAMFGEVPVAFVAIAQDASLTHDEILSHCQLHLAKFKLPSRIIILPELPKGPTGKILRRALRGQLG